MKTIAYDNTADDLAALHKHSSSPKAIVQRLRERPKVAIVILFGILSLLIFMGLLFNTNLWSAMLWALVFYPFSMLMTLFLIRQIGIWTVKRNPDRFSYKGFVGHYNLHLMNDHLQLEYPMGTFNLFYEGIFRLEETKTHLFIFVSDRNAYTVPKQDIDTEQFEHFKAQLQAQLSPKVPYSEFK